MRAKQIHTMVIQGLSITPLSAFGERQRNLQELAALAKDFLAWNDLGNTSVNVRSRLTALVTAHRP